MKRLTAVVIAAVCSLGVVANAAARDHRDHGPRHHHHRDFDRGHRGGPPAWHRHSAPKVIVVPPPRHGPPPHGHAHWRRGDRLPAHYMAPRYVVDWRRHHFRPPPRGHHWVHVNGAYLLVGIATGIILDSIINH